MIRDITLGQYYPGYSAIHNLDARLKIILTLLYMVSVFIASDFAGYVIIFIFVATAIKISKVPVRFIMRGLKPIFLIIAFTFILNMLMTDGTVIVQFWVIKITYEGLYRAIFMALRIVFLIIGSSILTFTTKPVKMTDGMESLFKPFVRFGLPAHELAMMMTIALRFIPTLLEETDKIMKAQISRGADFETGSIFKRAKNLIPIFIPLLIGAFRMASDLAMAMEARCYRGGEGRTKLHVFKFRRKDAVAIIVFAIFLSLVILSKVFHVQEWLLGLI